MSKRTCYFISIASALSVSAAAMAQETITYDQILADPSNIDLNYAFARQRMDAGDLVSASATLERILFIEPNWDDARLLYAGVLYRLGDNTAAQRELDLLDGRALSQDSKAQLQAYQAKVTGAESKTHYSARLSVGLGYDENAGFLLAEDVGASTPIDQFSFVGRASGEIKHSLNDTSNKQLFARGDFFTKQFDDEEFDGYMVTTVRAGLRDTRATFGYQVNLSARNVNFQGSEYLTEVGAEGSVSRKINGKTAVGAILGYHDQQFTSVFGAGDPTEGRTGDRIDGAAFVKHGFTPRFRGTARIDVRDKSADISDFSYTFVGGQLGAEYFCEDGSYIDADAIYRDYEYDGAFGTGVSQREDQYTYGRVAYGLPLGNLAPEGAPGENLPLTLETSVYYTSRTSNIDVFDFDGVGVEARLIWKFGK